MNNVIKPAFLSCAILHRNLKASQYRQLESLGTLKKIRTSKLFMLILGVRNITVSFGNIMEIFVDFQSLHMYW